MQYGYSEEGTSEYQPQVNPLSRKNIRDEL